LGIFFGIKNKNSSVNWTSFASIKFVFGEILYNSKFEKIGKNKKKGAGRRSEFSRKI
jgi:hypothetical protein